MNKVIFDKYLEDAIPEEDDLFPHHLHLPTSDLVKEIKFYGMVPLAKQ
jgi:hypothetical protein